MPRKVQKRSRRRQVPETEDSPERSPKLKMPEIVLKEAPPPAVETIRQANATAEPPDMSDLTLNDSSGAQHQDRTAVEKQLKGTKKRQNDVTVNALTPSIPPAKMCQSKCTDVEPLEATCLPLEIFSWDFDTNSLVPTAEDDMWAMLNNREESHISSESQSEIFIQPSTPARPSGERPKEFRRPLFSAPPKEERHRKNKKAERVARGSGDGQPDERDEYEMTPWRQAREDLRHREGKRIPSWATGDNLRKGLFVQNELFQGDTSAILTPCPTNWVPFPDSLMSPIRDCPTHPTPVKPEDKGYNIAVYVIRMDRSK